MNSALEVEADDTSSPRSSGGDQPGREEGFTLIIPAYNEELGIAEVLEKLRGWLAPLKGRMPVQVIVVDDGSTDKTAEILEAFSDEITLLRHTENRGYGAALKTGIRSANHPWVLITDADGTYPNESIPELLEHRNTNHMVVGARTGTLRQIPLIRRPPKWVLRKLASFLSRTDIPDLNSGLRIMRKATVERFIHLLPNGFSFTTTITLALLSAAYPVKYVPINYMKRAGKSKIRPIADTLNFLTLIIRTITYFEPLRVFIPLALLFILGAFAVGFGSYYGFGRFMDVTTVLLFVTGVQLMALGMVADVMSRNVR